VSITAKVKYLKSVLRFLTGFSVISASIAWCESEVGDRASFPLSKGIPDTSQNIKLRDMEPFTDRNGNNIWDPAEPFTDKGNGIYDVGEEFVDINGNNIRDLELWYVDKNKNGKWDAGDPFEDLDDDGKKSYKDPYTDNNNNNIYDAPEKTGDYKFNFNAVLFSEPFTDASNGQYDIGERFEDLNSDGMWTDAEQFEDLNSDGLWSPIEKEESSEEPVKTVILPEPILRNQSLRCLYLSQKI